MKTAQILFLSLVLSASIVFANDKINLSEHGSDLMKASFPTRYAFSRQYSKEWTDSTYAERKEFLTKWHNDELAQIKKETLEQKAQAQADREKEKEKREIAKASAEKLKARKQKEKNESKENKDRKKTFNSKIRNIERQIKEQRDNS